MIWNVDYFHMFAVSVGGIFLFVNISAPENSTKLVLYSKFKYGSKFSEEKKRFRNLFIGFRDIKQTNILTFF